MSYAAIATKLRREFKLKASSQTEESKDPIPKEAERELDAYTELKRNVTPIVKEQIPIKMLQGHEHNSGSSRRKRLSMK